MKVRRIRKRTQDHIRRNRSWDWSFEKFTRAVIAASARMSRAMSEVYAKSREEMRNTA
jgi:tellurite resistance protein